MDVYPLFQALVLGIVEGLTEFLPISSTGHLILAGDLLGFNDERGKLFEIVIQSGAILAIVWEYRARFTSVLKGLPGDPIARRFVTNLAIAFTPLAVLGLFFGKAIKANLFAPVPVARFSSQDNWLKILAELPASNGEETNVGANLLAP